MSVSRRDGDLIMGLINIILFLAFQRSNGPMDARHVDVIAQMPQNIRAALSKFDLDSWVVVYAVCPVCHCTYKPRYDEGSTYPIYNEFCTNRPEPESDICGESLLCCIDDDNGHHVMKPIKLFIYHDFHDYLASLLSRADLEEAMDKSWDELMRTRDDPIPEYVEDVWEAEFLRTFEGPSLGTIFIDRQGEGRYGFTLNINFGCEHVGRLLLVDLYRWHVLIYPPSTTQLNHYAKPVIDALVESWDNGVWYSHTSLHPHGKTTHSAVIAAVMDLPAASQLTGHSNHFYCSACQCFHRSTMGRTDHTQWVMHDVAKMRRNAERWLHTSTSKEREDIFKQHGTHWSEFWRLQYWDPTRQLVVDAMHCILEGLAQQHFRFVLSLTSSSAANEPLPQKAFSHNFTKIEHNGEFPNNMTLKEVKQVDAIHGLLTMSLEGVGDNGHVVDQESFTESLLSLTRRLSSKNLWEWAIALHGRVLVHLVVKNLVVIRV
ncbi:hypothetical protein PILCRDRAFT_12008 [Piloderma croceum F 1598]|uniref:Uncharacterized protein n=1 Tax=Piloderma croceum (strain F 1598) TaxID=765440 RepID=A0A0C3FBW3_PILCF|nr:hypothetical protein PILCRDRAFT_12008 [Piloderma croceum F 1598]